MPTIDLTWYKPTPSAWDVGLGRTKWAELSNPGSIPAEKVWLQNRNEYTPAEIFAKGVNSIPHGDIASLPPEEDAAIVAAGKSCISAMRTEHYMGLTPAGPDNWKTAPDGTVYNEKWWPTGPLTQAQAEARAYSFPVNHRIFIGESEEGDSWIDSNHPMWKWFWDIAGQRHHDYWATRGMEALTNFNYFNIGGPSWMFLQSSLAESKSKANGPVSDMGLGRFSTTGTLRRTNLILEGIYLNEPDESTNSVIKALFKQLVYKKAGYKVGFYLQGVYEWRPNNFSRIPWRQSEYATNWGDLYRANKIPLAAEMMMSYAALGLLYLDLVSQWGGEGKRESDNVNTGWGAYDLWFKEGNTSPESVFRYEPSLSWLANNFNRYEYGSGPVRGGYGDNNFAFGVNMYKSTFAQTHGGVRYYPRYRENGGPWISQTGSEFDILAEAGYGLKRVVVAERLAGKISLCSFFQTGPPERIHLEIEHPTDPTKIYSSYVCGSATYMQTITE